MEVYKAINRIQDELSKVGVEKTRKNGMLYDSRGIDEIMIALSPIMAKHELVMLPRMIGRTQFERQTNKGITCQTILDIEYDLVSTKDGSKHTVRVFGEAMDPGDKSTNKAMSLGYKYAAIQAFCIPVKGLDDGEHDLYELSEPNQVRLHDKSRVKKYREEPEYEEKKPFMSLVLEAMEKAKNLERLEKVYERAIANEAYKEHKIEIDDNYERLKSNLSAIELLKPETN